MYHFRNVVKHCFFVLIPIFIKVVSHQHRFVFQKNHNDLIPYEIKVPASNGEIKASLAAVA